MRGTTGSREPGRASGELGSLHGDSAERDGQVQPCPRPGCGGMTTFKSNGREGDEWGGLWMCDRNPLHALIVIQA